MHLGGFAVEEDEANPGGTLLVDTHSTIIAEPAWNLYAHAVRRFGVQPTLIEWDNDLPTFATIMNEAMRADSIAADALDRRQPHAASG
jgi:uncharacterized protein (UPF0276 family)